MWPTVQVEGAVIEACCFVLRTECKYVSFGDVLDERLDGWMDVRGETYTDRVLFQNNGLGEAG